MERWEKEFAFRTLLESAMKTRIDKIYRRTLLKKHPFDLPRLELKFKGNDLWRSYHRHFSFVGKQRSTDIESMRREAVKLLTGPILEYDLPKLQLRVILAEADKDDPKQHYIFFEMASPAATLMCGGCTDYSGAGKSGKEEMDRFFALLADIYDVQIEKVTIPYIKALPAIRAIEDEISEYHRE